MSYTKQTWTTGDTVTATKLNHMEDGIAGAGSGYDAEILVEDDGEGGYTGTIISGDYSTLSSMISNNTLPLVRANFNTATDAGVFIGGGVAQDEGFISLSFSMGGPLFICEWADTDTLNIYQD